LLGLQVFGYSLNIFTLGALTIAIGRVVDDSVVVIENIKRHMAMGQERREAIVTAVQEVALGCASRIDPIVVELFRRRLPPGGGSLLRGLGVGHPRALLADRSVEQN
jgi:HAE1 family hydrophobic/amphiphilic exporter-1